MSHPHGAHEVELLEQSPRRVLGGHNESMNVESLSPAPLPDLFRQVAPGYQVPDPFDAPGLRWGILGPGGIARTFARDVPAASNQLVTAVGSRSQARANKFAEEFGLDDGRAYGSYDQLVEDPDIDIVYVATPHIRHQKDALLALRAGKPVLVEKAFAMSEQETREVFETAADLKLFVMEGMWSRHLPHYAFMRSLLQSGRLGALRSVQADHGQSLRHVARLVNPELGGGALLDLGVYPIHLAQMLLGIPSELLSASRLSDQGVDVSDVVVGSYPGATSVSSCQLDTLSPTVATLVFEKGLVYLQSQFYRPTRVDLRVDDVDSQDLSIVGTKHSTWDARVPGGFQYQAADAARSIAAGDLESTVVPWGATLEVQRIMDTVLRNAGYVGK